MDKINFHVDLRSDTVTKPTNAMYKSMKQAQLGDDVFGEDITTNEFQEEIAAFFGMDAALFVPSGTMANQLAVKVLTSPSDEVLLASESHIFNYETSASSVLSGVQLTPIVSQKGKINKMSIDGHIRGKYDWEPNTKLIVLENTVNKTGGVCYSYQEWAELYKYAKAQGLLLHTDGARLWHAIEHAEIPPNQVGKLTNSLAVCFSKGLGAPVGSMLLSSKANIKLARRWRKIWGGGMRQVGVLSSAARYAFHNHRSLLKQSHIHAKQFAQILKTKTHFEVLCDVETNIVIFRSNTFKPNDILDKLKNEKIYMLAIDTNTLRATFHFQITDDMMSHIEQTFTSLF